MDAGGAEQARGCRGAVRTWGCIWKVAVAGLQSGLSGVQGGCAGDGCWRVQSTREGCRGAQRQGGMKSGCQGTESIPGVQWGAGRGPTSHRRCAGRDWAQGMQGGLRRGSGGSTSHRKRAGRDGVWEEAGGSGWVRELPPLAEGVQAGQHLGVAVAVEADAADQELLVNLPHHRAGGLMAGHGGSSAWQATPQ